MALQFRETRICDHGPTTIQKPASCGSRVMSGFGVESWAISSTPSRLSMTSTSIVLMPISSATAKPGSIFSDASPRAPRCPYKSKAIVWTRQANRMTVPRCRTTEYARERLGKTLPRRSIMSPPSQPDPGRHGPATDSRVIQRVNVPASTRSRMADELPAYTEYVPDGMSQRRAFWFHTPSG